MPDPLLLLPGTLCDAALWRRAELPAGARVLNVVRGASLAGAAALALEGAAERIHLVGFSLGAIVAFEVLRRAPQRVARLTLISATARAATDVQRSLWARQAARVRAGAFAEVVAALPGTGQGEPGTGQDEVQAMAQRVGPEAFLEQLALLGARPDSRPALARYGGPLTVLVGQEDQITPPRLAQELAELAPQASVRSVPQAGHYLPLAAPQAVSAALQELAHA